MQINILLSCTEPIAEREDGKSLSHLQNQAEPVSRALLLGLWPTSPKQSVIGQLFVHIKP